MVGLDRAGENGLMGKTEIFLEVCKQFSEPHRNKRKRGKTKQQRVQSKARLSPEMRHTGGGGGVWGRVEVSPQHRDSQGGESVQSV